MMTDDQYMQLVDLVATGSTRAEACRQLGTTMTYLMIYLSTHVYADQMEAALLSAESEARLAKADALQQRLSERINEGLVTTPAIARVETDQITKLRREGSQLQDKSAKLISKVRAAEKKRMVDANEARIEAAKKARGRGSWADAPMQHDPVMQAIENELSGVPPGPTPTTPTLLPLDGPPPDHGRQTTLERAVTRKSHVACQPALAQEATQTSPIKRPTDISENTVALDLPQPDEQPTTRQNPHARPIVGGTKQKGSWTL